MFGHPVRVRALYNPLSLENIGLVRDSFGLIARPLFSMCAHVFSFMGFSGTQGTNPITTRVGVVS